jgi:hypothetical protein
MFPGGRAKAIFAAASPIAFNTAEGYARDVSHDIALAAVERARKELLN